MASLAENAKVPQLAGRRSSLHFTFIALLLLIAAQWIAYRHAFAVQPAGDDWTTWGDVLRSNRHGWQIQFIEGGFRYRPFKGLLIWWFANINPANPWPWVRALHLLAAGFFAGV